MGLIPILGSEMSRFPSQEAIFSLQAGLIGGVSLEVFIDQGFSSHISFVGDNCFSLSTLCEHQSSTWYSADYLLIKGEAVVLVIGDPGDPAQVS